ncbi:MAG: NAD-dependent epimerase/dehydratase family protein [Candidatus Caldatribacteriaceae bacterium]
MRIFLSGGSGYLGSNLLSMLLRHPDVTQVICLIRNSQKKRLLEEHFSQEGKVEWVIGDLQDEKTYLHALPGVDTIIHAAGLRETKENPVPPKEMVATNVLGTARLLEGALASGVSRFLYCSTQAIYGVRQPIPISEDVPPCPETLYALTKYAGELLGEKARERGLRFLVLRFARLYGKGLAMRKEELPHRFAQLSAQGAPLPVYEEGRTMVDLLHVRDAVRAIGHFLSPEKAVLWNEVYNVGSGNPTSVHSLAQTCQRVCEKLGMPIPPIKLFPLPPGSTPRAMGLAIAKIQGTGWKPSVPLQDGLTELILAARHP